jgi:hypothetical protein
MKNLLLSFVSFAIICLCVINVNFSFSSKKTSSIITLKNTEALATENSFPSFCNIYNDDFLIGDELQRRYRCIGGIHSECKEGMDIFYRQNGEWTLTYQHSYQIPCPFL